MVTLLAFAIVLSLGLTGVALSSISLTRAERAIVPFAAIAHVAAAIAHVWMVRNVYGGGDMLLYWDQGQALASTLGHDPTLFLKTVVLLITQNEEVRVPVTVYGVGTSTGTMAGIGAAFAYFIPTSFEAACALVSLGALSGKLLIYRALRGAFNAPLRRPILLATLVLPSSVFWSAGLLKEAAVLLPLGLAVMGAHAMVNRSWTRAAAFLVPGVIGIALFKPYIVLALSLASAAWLYSETVTRRHGTMKLRPMPLAMVAIIGVGGATALGVFFPEYALTNLADEAARLQDVGTRVDGGSNYFLASSHGAGPLQQLAMAPFALIAGLFRPFVFEARNFQMLLAAVETTFIAALTLRVFIKGGAAQAITRPPYGPTVVFCLAFSLLMAVSVGLASTNLGTLSRYRMPMTPFLMCALLVLGQAPRRQTIAPRLLVRTS